MRLKYNLKYYNRFARRIYTWIYLWYWFRLLIRYFDVLIVITKLHNKGVSIWPSLLLPRHLIILRSWYYYRPKQKHNQLLTCARLCVTYSLCSRCFCLWATRWRKMVCSLTLNCVPQKHHFFGDDRFFYVILCTPLY